MDNSYSAIIENKDKQNIEMFKFFEKTSRTSSKSNKKTKPVTFNLPMRRTTRLKSEIFVESYPEVLPDGKFDISKEDFSHTKLTFEPIKKKIKLSNADLEMESDRHDDGMSEIFNGTNSILDNTIESIDPEQSPTKSKKLGKKSKVEEFEKFADNMIETIDTNVIIEMLKGTSLEKAKEALAKKPNVSKQKITENCDQNLNKTPSGNVTPTKLAYNDNDCTKSENVSKQTISRKSIAEKLRETNVENDKTHDSEPQTSLRQTINCDTNTKSNQPKKRGRKSIAEKIKQSNIENELEDKKLDYQMKQTQDTYLENILYCETNLNNTQNGSVPQTDLTYSDKDCTKSETAKQSKKRGRKSMAEKLKQTNISYEAVNIKEKYQTKQSKNSDLENVLPDDDSHISLTPNDDNDLSQVAKTFEPPIKRGRKLQSVYVEKIKHSNIVDKPRDLGNVLPDNDSQISLTTNGDIDTKKAEKKLEHQTKQTKNSDLENILPDDGCQISLTPNDDNDMSQVTKTSEPPKKRGRKPKSLIVEKIKQSNVVNKPEDLGNVLPDNDSQISLTTNGDIETKKVEKKSEPKKRGRKPKSLNTTLPDTSGSISNSTTIKTGILKYFNVENKQLEDIAKNKNSPMKKKNETETENSELLINNILNDKNLQVSQNCNNASIEMTANLSEQQRIESNTINTADTSLTNFNLNTTANTEPKKRGRPKAPRVIKVNVAREFQKKQFIKFSKLTKDQMRKGGIRKIPKNRLEDVLEMIDNEDHPIWEDRNISCNTSIYGHWESRYVMISDQNIKLNYARQFLLRRDWISLSKILYLSNTEAKTYYPLLAKYATLLLAHTDKEQFNKCVQFLTSINDSRAVIKKCTKISKENED